MSKLTNILELIRGTHVMGDDPFTREYHAAKLVRDAGRIKDDLARFNAIKRALHPYRVTVTYSASGTMARMVINVRRNSDNQTLELR